MHAVHPTPHTAACPTPQTHFHTSTQTPHKAPHRHTPTPTRQTARTHARLVTTLSQVGDVRGPELQAVKDVRGVDDGGPALLALVLEEAHEVGAAQHVQVDRDLVQQQHLRYYTVQCGAVQQRAGACWGWGGVVVVTCGCKVGAAVTRSMPRCPDAPAHPPPPPAARHCLPQIDCGCVLEVLLLLSAASPCFCCLTSALPNHHAHPPPSRPRPYPTPQHPNPKSGASNDTPTHTPCASPLPSHPRIHLASRLA